MNGSSMTVMKNGKTYTVNTSANTVIRRRFTALSSLSQISVGDLVDVWGNWVDVAHTVINASRIRDASIQERRDTFSGTVVSVSSSGFVLASISRGNQTVTVDSSTTLVDRNGQTIALSSIAVGDSIRLDGLWDRTLSTIKATWVKDTSLPR